MAVYRMGYRRYAGPVTGRWERFWVLPRVAWRRLFAERLIVALLVAALVWPLLCALYIYVSHQAELLAGMAGPLRDLAGIGGPFFIVFMRVQAILAVLVAALAGTGLIAPDLADNALQLYFSRPLSRAAYILGRLLALSGLLSLVTWVPGLVLFGIQAGMAGGGWAGANWRLGAGIVAGLGAWILLVSLVALAASAAVKMRVVAGGLVLGFFFVLGGATAMINAVFRSTWAGVLNPAWAARRLWYALLGVDPPAGPGAWESAAALVILALLLLALLARRLRPVEVTA
jgi:ABC-2 type transport system permease protein